MHPQTRNPFLEIPQQNEVAPAPQPKVGGSFIRTTPMLPKPQDSSGPVYFDTTLAQNTRSNVCYIISELHRQLRDENTSDNGGGGGESPKKTFTQEDFDRAIGKVRAEERKKFADYDELKAKVAEFGGIREELDRLKEERELEGKSAAERERISAEKAAKALERERADSAKKLSEAEAKASGFEKRFRDMVISRSLGEALTGAGVIPDATVKAAMLLQQDATVDLDDDMKISGFTYGGVAYKDAAEVAKQFLKDNAWLAKANPAQGGGTTPPNGTGGHSDRSVREQSAEENFAAGLSTPPKQMQVIPGAMPGFSAI